MSKAFTRENDDAPEARTESRPRASLLPPGARNYVTRDGVAAFRAELARRTQEAPPDAPAGGAPADPRIRELKRILQTAVVPPPPPPGEDRVRFGAWVRVRSNDGNVTRYRIVGVDEADPDRGWISWISPLARALIKARTGDGVRLQTPEGENHLEIVAVEYDDPAP